MSTEAEELAKTFAGIRVRTIMIILASCAGFIAALGYGAEGYVNLGGPIPATRTFVMKQMADLERSVEQRFSDASNHRDDIASFSKETRALLLQREYNTALERIMDLEEKIKGGSAARETRMLLRAKRIEADAVKRQLDRLTN